MVPMSTDPKAPPDILIATVGSVAQGQLETAILLWFQYGDPASIHTLAAAANGCYHAAGGNNGTQTSAHKWLRSLRPKDRVAATRAQNFFKHGPDRRTKGETKVRFRTEHAELLMLDCIICHEQLFPKRTPLMTCFFARLTYETPRLLAHINQKRREQGREDFTLHKLVEPDRWKYLQEVLPAMTAMPGA